MSRPTRKQMFDATRKSSGADVIPATVSFIIDKKKGRLRPLSPTGKMLCALRKVLASMSDNDENGCRFYIDNNKVQLTKRPTSPGGAPGEARTYTAAGRCKLGVCHPEGHKSSVIIQFNISYRDVKDDRGLDDIEFFDPTTIDKLPRSTPISTAALG